MSASTPTRALPLPREAECPYAPAPEVAVLREESPVTRVVTPTGLDAWLVTRHADVREVLGDPVRFSNRPGQAAHVLAHLSPDKPIEAEEFSRMDGPEHLRFRRVFGPVVSMMKRVEDEYRPLVQRVVDERLDALAEKSEPIELHEEFSKPITTAVIAELLGVPYAERGLFHRAAEALFSSVTGADEVSEKRESLTEYVGRLVAQRRAERGTDMLSRLITKGEQADPPMSDRELTAMGSGLLIAGYDTTASVITYGTLALLQQGEQFAALREDPSLAVNATEELVRYLGVGIGLMREATRDTEIGGVPIAKGEFVIAAVQSANHDPSQFTDPGRLDVTRSTKGHLGFGHGPHQCVGQQIARIELQSVLATLARRVPSLRLAVPFEEIEFKRDTVVLGPARLPVTWDRVLPAQD
ncbi:cytochrome P450 [Streptomyces sp. NPDC003077]|uniref:cytochrome P450 n=1 Tax=Streptomyces sp. NPDC003077 TaxID=3154443 RepID=UPI00339F70C4